MFGYEFKDSTVELLLALKYPTLNYTRRAFMIDPEDNLTMF